MNAAFLLVTTAWLAAGQTPPPAAPVPAAPAASAACGGGCGSCVSDPCGCEGFGHRLRDHLRGMFSRNDCCNPAPCCKPAPTCCKPAPTCCAPKTCCEPVCHHDRFTPRCDSCIVREWHWPHRSKCDSCQPACAPVKTCCAPVSTCCAPVRASCCPAPVKTCCSAPACSSCDSCANPGLLERLRGLFRRHDCGCDSCGGNVTPAPAVVPIAPPKKMPTAPPMKSVQIDNNLTPAPVPTTIVPGFEPAPAPVPNIDTDNKN